MELLRCVKMIMNLIERYGKRMEMNIGNHKILFYLMTFVITTFTPTHHKLILLSAEYGRAYRGNTRVLFEYLVKNHTEYQIIWITYKRDLFQKLHDEFPNNVVYFYSWKGLMMIGMAKYIITQSYIHDFPGVIFNSNKQIIIQLWHGLLLKKIFIPKERSIKKRNKIRRVVKKYYNAVISTSDLYTYIISTCLNMPYEKIHITGLPRNDVLYDKIDKSKLIKQIIPEAPTFSKIILYAPTFRDDEELKIFPFQDIDLKALNDLLKSQSSILLIHAHIADLNRGFAFDTQYNRIINLDMDNLERDLHEIQEVLAISDVLITDYSSISFDFLLLDRPIIYFPYDYENYKKTRGFLLDFFQFSPGPKVYTFNDFLGKLHTALSGKDGFENDRDRINKLYNYYTDNQSSARVVKIIEQIDKDELNVKGSDT